ncbi:MAG: dienelactone hydrolase family protein [Acidobacteria bacterium]|nr:dienelactone hydrolase family protein [Acidobacteriota bacterium]
MLRLATWVWAAVCWGQPLPGVAPLQLEGDAAALLVDGLHRFLDRYQRPQGTPSVERLKYILGIVEPLTTPSMEVVAGKDRVKAVRWPVLPGLHGEGLLLEPAGKPLARVVALPDADWTPEMLAGLVPGVAPESQFARRLADNGVLVLIPTLMDRRSTYSGVPAYRMTNMPHREFLWRLGFPIGRHIIGIEVQKILAAVGWFAKQNEQHRARIAVAGYGEGGLLALDAAAIDSRIEAALVSGYFGPRDQVWQEPVYRDVWGLLPDYRDAQLARMIAPRKLIVETAPGPRVDGPPPETKERRGAAPAGRLTPASYESVAKEAAGTKAIVVRAEAPGSDAALSALLDRPIRRTAGRRPALPVEGRFERQFRELVEYTQRVMRESHKERGRLWSAFDKRAMRERIWNDLIGRLPAPSVPPNPRTRLVYDEPAFRGYEVLLDVWPEVAAYGILLVPKDIKPGERRPAVVCQHGLEGRPKDVADPHFRNPTYNQFAVRLAELGFVTFSPQNAYTGGDRFRQVQRKAHPWQLSLFSFITGQHQRILEWLGSLDFIDPARIGFYGLSYGGFTAMRVPALLENYALSICSGNFNEWVWKTASLDAPFVYPLTQEYEIPEYNFAHLANHFELATLIFPRPFMVERGHNDGVSRDEWVAYEYAKVFRFYAQNGMGERTTIEYFNGPHVIHGAGTFEFLRKHLGSPRGLSSMR